MSSGGEGMSELAIRLKACWQANGVSVRPGVSEREIEAFEAAQGVVVPEDSRTYLSAVDGTEEGDWDEQLFEWFPLQRIKSVPYELADFGGIPDYRGIIHTLEQPAEWYVFINYLIFSHVYAVRFTPTRQLTTPVLWILGSKHYRIAGSLSEFLNAYLEDPNAVFCPPDT